MPLLKSMFLAIVLTFPSAIDSVTAANDIYASGFLDSLQTDESISPLVTFPDSSLPPDNPLFYFTQWIFPNINFTCNVNITGWRLRVNNSVDSGNVQRSIPQIATWRLQNSFSITNSYILHYITNESHATVTVAEAGIYEYTLSQPVSVQAGDMVGIMMPTNEDERLRSVGPLFLRLSEGNSSTVSCTRLGDSQHFFLANGTCLNQLQQQFLYIPLLTAITSQMSPTINSPSLPTIFDSTAMALSPSSLDPAPTVIINVAPTLALPISTAPDEDISPTTTRLDKGLILGSMVAGATMLILAIMSVVIVIATLCLKPDPTSNGLQQEVLKDGDSVTPQQLELEDYETSEMKSNCAYISNSQQVLIVTEDNVAYYIPRGNVQCYSNDQCDYEEIP